METMQPGRELDALVAEKVMGLEPWPGRSGAFKATIVRRGEQAVSCDPPEYSTDIAAAWDVVGALQQSGFEIKLATIAALWVVTIYGPAGEFQGTGAAPHAICLAALRAVRAL